MSKTITMGRIVRIKTMGDDFSVGDATDGYQVVGIQYKRDGSTASYKGPEGCYEVIGVTTVDIEKKEANQEKKDPPLKVVYTIPGRAVVLITHDIAEEKPKKKEEKPLVLERVPE